MLCVKYGAGRIVLFDITYSSRLAYNNSAYNAENQMLSMVHSASSSLVGMPLDQIVLNLLRESADDETVAQASIGVVSQGLGYPSVAYLCCERQQDGSMRVGHWMNSGSGWVDEYERCHYIRADPIVGYGRMRDVPPLAWDETLAQHPLQDHVLQRAAAHKIGCGVAIFLRDQRRSIIVMLSWPHRRLSRPDHQHIVNTMQEASDFAVCLHWLVMRRATSLWARSYCEVLPLPSTCPLSERELACLQLASQGMTSIDIGRKLGITTRTADFHFGNLIRKLGVLNRKEAIAFSIANGLTVGPASPVPYRATARSAHQLAIRQSWTDLRVPAAARPPVRPE